MKFFVPLGRDEARERQVYHSLKRSLSKVLHTKVTRQEIYGLHCQYNGQDYHLDVGQPHPVNGETIMVILCGVSHATYYVCTQSRGVSQGEPFVVDAQDVLSVTELAVA